MVFQTSWQRLSFIMERNVYAYRLRHRRCIRKTSPRSQTLRKIYSRWRIFLSTFIESLKGLVNERYRWITKKKKVPRSIFFFPYSDFAQLDYIADKLENFFAPLYSSSEPVTSSWSSLLFSQVRTKIRLSKARFQALLGLGLSTSSLISTAVSNRKSISD